MSTPFFLRQKVDFMLDRLSSVQENMKRFSDERILTSGGMGEYRRSAESVVAEVTKKEVRKKETLGDCPNTSAAPR